MAVKLGLGNGYVLGVSTTTAKQRINMSNIRALGVLLVGAGGPTALTLNECNANATVGGTEQALACITTFWTYAAQATPSIWVKNTQVAGSAATPASGGVLYFEVLDTALSDGFSYIDVTHATATTVFIGFGNRVGRSPESLRLWNL